ncbi:MAG: Do family serine endopeptidase [Spirochaetia bacterium]
MRLFERLKHRRAIFYVLSFVIIGAMSFAAGSVLASPSREEAPQQPVPLDRDPVPEASVESAYSLQDSFRQVAEAVLPVVVEVNVVEVVRQQLPEFGSPFDFFFGPRDNQQDPQEREFRRPGLGSGVIVRKDGKTVYVLTNTHVAGNAEEINVVLYDGREYEATIVGADSRLDLALLEFEAKDEIPLAVLGNSDDIYVGDWALAVGNPYGFESTVTAGIISAVSREATPGMQISGFTNYIQTDAAINPGNSGGALVNLEGEIIGINTWIASQSGGSVGVGFAIPVNIAKRAIDDFLSEGRITYGWLGVSIQDPGPNTLPGVAADLGIEGMDGSLVINVYTDSPAAKSGIQPGDFIVEVGNTEIENSNHLTRVVGNLKPGASTEFTFLRGGRRQNVDVTLETRLPEEELAQASNLWPGMTVVGLTDEIRSRLELSSDMQGVVIASVYPGTTAEQVGFKGGDIVTAIERKQIDGPADFYRAVGDPASDEVMFRITRQGKEMLLGLVRQ